MQEGSSCASGEGRKSFENTAFLNLCCLLNTRIEYIGACKFKVLAAPE
jgi:hypothetical protein